MWDNYHLQLSQLASQVAEDELRLVKHKNKQHQLYLKSQFKPQHHHSKSNSELTSNLQFI
jgi:hypothetical protein